LYAYSIQGSNVPKLSIEQISKALEQHQPSSKHSGATPGYQKEVVMVGDSFVITYNSIYTATMKVADQASENSVPALRLKEQTLWNNQFILDRFSRQIKADALVCQTSDLASSTSLLQNYLTCIGVRARPVFNYEYRLQLLQQLLETLYWYWPVSESAVTAIKIGDNTITTRHSGRGAYDVRIHSEKDSEVKKALTRGEKIENITIIPPHSVAGSTIDERICKVTLYHDGKISTRARITEQNLKMVWAFIEETNKILDQIEGGKRPSGFQPLEPFFGAEMRDSRLDAIRPRATGQTQSRRQAK
jgi:hypothetical protein